MGKEILFYAVVYAMDEILKKIEQEEDHKLVAEMIFDFLTKEK